MLPERTTNPHWHTEFIDDIEAGRAEYFRCESCGAAELPPRNTCPECGSTAVVARDLPTIGDVLTFTEVRTTIEKFEDEAPYTVVIVELADSLRLAGQLRDADDVAIGDRVRLGVEHRDEREDIVTYESA